MILYHWFIFHFAINTESNTGIAFLFFFCFVLFSCFCLFVWFFFCIDDQAKSCVRFLKPLSVNFMWGHFLPSHVPIKTDKSSIFCVCSKTASGFVPIFCFWGEGGCLTIFPRLFLPVNASAFAIQFMDRSSILLPVTKLRLFLLSRKVYRVKISSLHWETFSMPISN